MNRAEFQDRECVATTIMFTSHASDKNVHADSYSRIQKCSGSSEVEQIVPLNSPNSWRSIPAPQIVDFTMYRGWMAARSHTVDDNSLSL